MSKITVLVLDVLNGKGLYEAEIEQDNIHDIYPLLGCDCFDIAYRKIGGKCYDIFCDDEGLFKDSPVTSAIYKSTMGLALVGNLMFANHDLEGNTTGLSKEDIDVIKKNVVGLYDFDSGKSWNAIFIE